MAEQKLNIVFTGDVSQLTKAIQSAEAELTSFENKLKDSLGTEAFASINQSVDQLKNKFQTLSSIDIKANPQQALTAINEVFTDISKLKSSEVLLKANNKDALAAIQQLESFVKGIRADITVGVDSSGVTREIEGLKTKLSDLKAKVSFAINESEANRLKAEISETLSRIDVLKAVKIDIDSGDVLGRIREIESELQDLNALKVAPEVSPTQLKLFEQNIQVLEERLVELKKFSIEVPIKPDIKGFDTSKLQSLLTPLSTQVSVMVNTKAAEAEIKALLNQVKSLKGQDILINLDGTQVIRTVDAIEKELLQLQAKLKTATNPADIAKLTQQLQLFKNSLSSNNVNQFSSSVGKAQQATFAFSQVLREAPSFAFSLQTGLLGISNNLPILADRFKEARASGLSTGKIFSEMAKGLVSLPGLMTIASTAAIFLAGAFNKSGDKAKDFTEDLKEVRDVLSDSTASVQGDIAKVGALTKAFSDTTSFEKQKRIISELKDINKSYFGDLAAGKSSYEDITKAANAYTDALVQQAIVKGLQDAISDLARQLGEASIKYADATKTADDYRKKVEEINRKNATNVQGVTAQNREVNLASNAYNKLQGNVLEAGQAVGKITQRIEDFRKQLNLAVFKSLDFKPFKEEDVKDFKTQTEDILSRARAFVKQFGETFVVPDLEESFTNTKDKILKSAKKLLDDIANQKLIIKLPVQVVTEADFVQPEIKIDPNFKLDEGIRDRILKSIQEELKPIDATVDVTVTPKLISKDQTKAIDDLVKSFADLGDRGLRALQRIDFTDLNKGIKDGQKALQNLNEEFQITTEFSLALGESFSTAFSALLEGEDPIKAFFKSIISELQRLIVKLIAAKLAMAFLNVAFPGLGKVAALGGLGGGLGIGGQANFGFGGSGSLRALSVNVTGSVIQRGSDQLIMFGNSGRSLARIQ